MTTITTNDQVKKSHLKAQAYQIILDTINAMETTLLDPNGLVLSHQVEGVQITGYEEKEVRGKHFSLWYAEEETGALKPQSDLEKARIRGEYEFTELRLKKNGEAFCAEIKINTLYNHKGEAAGFHHQIKDITYKIIYEDVFNRIKKKYENLFENQFFENRLVGLFRVSLRKFKITRANSKALSICGINDMDQFSFINFFIDKNEKKKFIQEIQKNIFIDKYHFQARRADNGKVIWLSITCLVKKTEGYLEGIVVDITENKKQFEKLRKVNKALKKVNNELDQFIYHASHDLRSPLSTILGLISLIKLEKDSQLTEKYISLIEDRVNKLDALIKDLLAISQNDRHEVKTEKIDLKNEIKLLLKDYYYQESYRHVDVFFEIKQEAEFYTDAVRLRIILFNLLSNAIKYSNRNRKDAFIKINCIINEKKAFIQIEDNGIGIEKKFLPKIYRMFFRATELSKGSGLGLYIVKSTLEKLGGKIRVSSVFGEGTSFRIELPNQKDF